MQSFEIEFKRTSYITLKIDAKTLEEAQEAAWEELENDEYGFENAEWEITQTKFI